MSDTPITDQVAEPLYGLGSTPKMWVVPASLSAKLERELAAAQQTLAHIASIGEVYVLPHEWNSFKAGGPPSIEDCSIIDLEELAQP